MTLGLGQNQSDSPILRKAALSIHWVKSILPALPGLTGEGRSFDRLAGCRLAAEHPLIAYLHGKSLSVFTLASLGRRLKASGRNVHR